MPVYQIVLDGDTFVVEVPSAPSSPTTIIVNGQAVQATWRQGPTASTDSPAVATPPIAPRHGAPPTPSSGSNGNAITAPMPGKVLALKVAPGDHVDYGQEILTLEAMKMAQSIRSPRAGSIVAVFVAAGDTVRQGQSMVTLE
jgi:biotin carboxyl carrier protein